jgi:hypothetical protein
MEHVPVARLMAVLDKHIPGYLESYVRCREDHQISSESLEGTAAQLYEPEVGSVGQ